MHTSTYVPAHTYTCVHKHTHVSTHTHARIQMRKCTQALLYCAKTVPMPHNGQPTQIRVGMHTGPAVTGLIGTKLPKYGVFGDTM